MDFDQLYKRYFSVVYGLCLAQFGSEDFAREVTQEAFVKSLEHLEDLRDKDKFLAWVTSIAINYGRNKKKYDKTRFNQLPPVDLIEGGGDSLELRIQDLEVVNFIRSWILTQDPLSQQLLLLKFYYSRTIKEMGLELSVHPSTIKRRLAVLRAKLEEALKKEGHIC